MKCEQCSREGIHPIICSDQDAAKEAAAMYCFNAMKNAYMIPIACEMDRSGNTYYIKMNQNKVTAFKWAEAEKNGKK